MARPRTPTRILEARGSFKAHPERRRAPEPEPSKPIGAAPKSFDKRHKAIWEEHCKNFGSALLGNSDRIAMEILCMLTGEYRDAPVNMSNSKARIMTHLIRLFGGCPASRDRVAPARSGK